MAVAVALTAMILTVALATAIALLTATEIRLSGHHRDAAAVLLAAEAAAEAAADEVLATADWDALLAGGVRSAFTDGPPAGLRPIPGGTLDIAAETNRLRCGSATGCSAGDIAAATIERPWGPNNPVWQPYAYGRLHDLLATGADVPDAYVVVWVGDDGSECDGWPERDGQPCAAGENHGAGILVLQAHAFAAGGIGRGVEVTVARAPAPGGDPLRRTGIVSWHEIR